MIVVLPHGRLLQDVNLSSDAHNQALESLKVQLSHTQALLEQEKAATAALKVREKLCYGSLIIMCCPLPSLPPSWWVGGVCRAGESASVGTAAVVGGPGSAAETTRHAAR